MVYVEILPTSPHRRVSGKNHQPSVFRVSTVTRNRVKMFTIHDLKFRFLSGKSHALCVQRGVYHPGFEYWKPLFRSVDTLIDSSKDDPSCTPLVSIFGIRLFMVRPIKFIGTFRYHTDLRRRSLPFSGGPLPRRHKGSREPVTCTPYTVTSSLEPLFSQDVVTLYTFSRFLSPSLSRLTLKQGR